MPQNKDSISDSSIVDEACELTIQKLKTKGYKPSDYIYIEVENTLYDKKQARKHAIAVSWPDDTYCFFFSDSPIALTDLFPAQLRTAYYKSFYDQQRENNLG